MKRNDLADKLYTLSAFARCDYPDKDVLADALLDAARDAKKVSLEIAAYKMSVKSLEAKLRDARSRASRAGLLMSGREKL